MADNKRMHRYFLSQGNRKQTDMYNIELTFYQMESINKLSVVYWKMADKFLELNKELVSRNKNAEIKVKGHIEKNMKLTEELG